MTSRDQKIKIRDTDMPGEEDLHLLQRRLDDHIDDFNSHVKDQTARWESVVINQERTNASIDKLVTCTEQLHKSTEGVVSAWNTGSNIGRFAKWLSGVIIALGMIWALIKTGGTPPP